MAEQMALTNICETAMLTKDTMTAQHVAQRIMEWSGIKDTQIIESAVKCLSNHHRKKVVYSIEEGFQFSNTQQNKLLIHMAIQKVCGRILSLKIELVMQKIIFFKKSQPTGGKMLSLLWVIKTIGMPVKILKTYLCQKIGCLVTGASLLISHLLKLEKRRTRLIIKASCLLGLLRPKLLKIYDTKESFHEC